MSALTEELVKRGHDVTLFASGDSQTSAELVPSVSHSLRLNNEARDHVAYTITQLADVFRRQDDFDVIHSHVDYFAFPFAPEVKVPFVTTTHGRLDLPEIARVYTHFPDVPLVSISDSQRVPVPHLNWAATVYNGIDFGHFTFQERPGTYLAFLGRISPEKRVDRAIEVARELGMPLKIAAKVDAADRDYFEYAIRPQLAHPLVEFVGEVSDVEKNEFLGHAYAYLFPIDWPEPFGLTMVEAMACGTPVVAMKCGSVPEVVTDGVTGFICSSMRQFVDAVPRVASLDRVACRAVAEDRFSAQVMTVGYERVYGDLAAAGSRPAGLTHSLSRVGDRPAATTPAG